jgi:hypothetical protein
VISEKGVEKKKMNLRSGVDAFVVCRWVAKVEGVHGAV